MNNEELLKKISLLENQLKEKQIFIDQLQSMVDAFRRAKFYSKSEQVSSDQLGLFDEAELVYETAKSEDKHEEEKAQREGKARNRGQRAPLPENLAREEVIIELPESERICPKDGSLLKEIGEEISEKLKIIPPKVVVVKTIRKKYACLSCSETIKTAAAPLAILPKTNASASLLAFIICSKYADGLPLYRQEQIFKRYGIDIDDRSMARWVIDASDKLQPIYNLLNEKLIESDYIQMDETYVQVLKEEGRAAESKSFMWVRYRPGASPIVLFDYFSTRASRVPHELLQDFKGYLQVDGYGGYSSICEKEEVTRLGCWDHARRKFFEALKTNSGKKVGKKGIVLIDKLYKIEEEISEYSSEKKLEIRKEKSLPVLAEIKSWLEEVRHNVVPKSQAGEAVIYTLNQWSSLSNVFERGDFAISNKFVENAIRPFSIGRKNWLFSTSIDGANASAMFYSIISTAKANGLNAFDYLNNLFEKLPLAQTVDEIEALLPIKK